MGSRAAIVGAGPAGLTMARALAARGIGFDVFEAADGIGGLWNADDPASPVYDSAHLISSRTMTGFEGYPMPDTWADYPARDLILGYIRAFATDYGLMDHIRLSEPVERAEPGDDGWSVTTPKGSHGPYRWLIAANGSNRKPVIPAWPGKFSGTLRHAATYRSPDELKGKRLLIVGLGNSGVDIACDAARTATSVEVSIRRGYHLIPKHILGKPADVFADDSPPLPFPIRQRIFGTLLRILIGDLTKFGMPKPDHRLMETHPLLNDQFIHHLRHGDVKIRSDIERFDGETVHFSDGSSGTYEEVICATGYDWEAPYLADDVLHFEHGRLTNPLAIFTDRDDLFTLSFVESNGSSFHLFNEMTRVIANAIDDQDKGRTDATRRLAELARGSWDVTGGLKMLGTDRHIGYMDNRTYRKALKRLTKRMGWPDAPLAPPPGDAARAALP